MFSLESIEHRALGYGAIDVDRNLCWEFCEFPQLRWQPHSDRAPPPRAPPPRAAQGRVWASTESTAGKLLAAADQVSPASLEA